MELKKGARCVAKWLNTNFYYWCTIIEPVGEEWKIQYDDGTVAVVKTKDLHETPPADARNPVRIVTRSTPSKNRKRPEEIRKSPARKVRKLFTEEENIRLGAKLGDVKENATAAEKESIIESDLMEGLKDKESHENLTGAADVQPSLREKSVSKEIENPTQSAADVNPSSREKSVPKEIENLTQSVADAHPSSRERSVSVSKEAEDVTYRPRVADTRSSPFKRTDGVPDTRSSPFKRTVTVKREPEFATGGSVDIRLSPFTRSVSVTRETEAMIHNTGDVRQPPSRASVSVTAQTEDIKGGAEDVRPSLSQRSATVEIQKESFTRSVKTYAASYLDRDLRSLSSLDRRISSRLLKEGSVGSVDLHAGPTRRSDSLLMHGDSQRIKRENLMHDVPRYGKSYFEGDFQRRLLKEGSVGLADLRPSAIRGSDNLLNARGKVTPGSADLRPSAIRGSDSLLNERGKVTADLTRHTASNVDRGLQRQLVKEGSADFTLATTYVKDNEKKYLNKYPMEFGGRLGTLLLILLLPLYVLSLFSFNLVPDPTKFEVLFQMQLVLIPQVAVGIIMLIIFQAVLSIVPIGKVVSGPLTKLGILKMRCNGIFAALFALVLTSSVCYIKREVADIVVSVYSEAAVSAMLVGIVFSLILYRRGGKLPISYLNPYGSKGFMWYDFWMGREVTPRIGKFNIKLILHRFSIIIVIALNMLIATKAYLQGVEEEILRSVIISAILQSLYSLHFIFHEDLYLYSFLAISEGVGYMIAVGFMTFPFILTFTTKAILDYRLKASLTEMYIVLCSYTIGQILLQSSSHRKMLSLKNPVTSVWRVNVLPKWSAAVQTRACMGEIIIYWALALVAGTTYHGIFIIPSAFTVTVLSRAFREYKRAAAYQAGEVNTRQ
ncbi:delta(14)-sterol reductase LBR-like isoform X3 [Schistocerca nitens]|uniref:delta(14)-sterol reductase LBR-like isoform X2 n=1 Tax=Schistocerca nitens TaxID=7011 RepID=UPI002118ABD1|nr:delta(14)-sterol reductase LBR-like isoform X2 [Schistocerca nitens]XP_049804935.1 delta(14)-sterol reductase LBR-like isoform X3 [Schistocerca nitens]